MTDTNTPQGYNNPANDVFRINNRIVSDIATKKITNVRDVVDRVSLSPDQEISYDEVFKAVVNFKIATAKEIKQAMNHRKVIDSLGAYPDSCSEFINLYFKKQNISFDVCGNVIGHAITDDYSTKLQHEQERLNVLLDQSVEENYKPDIDKLRSELKILDNAAESYNSELTIDDLARKLRIVRDECGLSYNNQSITDCITETCNSTRNRIRTQTYMRICHEDNHDYSSSDAEWNKIVGGLFDTSIMSTGCTIASLKKFMWQVKRKMIGKQITNHTMVIIVGKQGTGKTTFVEQLLDPVREVANNTNMEEIVDNRNVDLFDYNVLFMDEMSRADRADIESVKNMVTAPKISRRVLHTSKTLSKKQNSVFIGCSNKNLDQIISDETGIRRFVPLSFKNNPDWTVLNDVDFELLWKSVNELSNDPSDDYMNEIKDIQAEYRTKTTCEDWVIHLKRLDTTQKYVDGRKWYVKFQQFEEIYYPHRNTPYSVWDREMNRLCNQSPELGFDCSHFDGTRYYKFSWETAHGIDTPNEGIVFEKNANDVTPNPFVDENGNPIPEKAKEYIKPEITISKEEVIEKSVKVEKTPSGIVMEPWVKNRNDIQRYVAKLKNKDNA